MKWSTLFVAVAVAFLGDMLFGQSPRSASHSTDEPTLPPVVVEPDTQPYSGGGASGTIPWSSNAVGSYDTRVGPYQQPDWTTDRPFATTRVYVLPPGQAQFEQWVMPTWPKHGNTEFRFEEEVSFGLPGRFQIDLYERWNVEPDSRNVQVANHEGIQVELRYALADWGVLPLNPTIYLEWAERGGPQNKPDAFEFKLLLGEEITPCLFFASNVIIEQEVEGDRETEVAWSNAFSVPLRRAGTDRPALFRRTCQEPASDAIMVWFAFSPGTCAGSLRPQACLWLPTSRAKHFGHDPRCRPHLYDH